MRINIFIKPFITILFFILMLPSIIFSQPKVFVVGDSKPEIPPLLVSKAENEAKLIGYTHANKTLIISAEVMGKIIKINYDIGDVIKDRPFIEIDTTFIDFEIERAKNSQKTLQLKLENANSQINYINKEYQRIETLYKSQRASEVQIESSRQGLEQAQIAFQTLSQEGEILKITLRELEERKKRFRITAPSGYIVTDRFVEEGNIIQPGIMLAKVSDFQKLVVPISVTNEEMIAITSLPENFKGELDGKPVKLNVDWINPKFDELTRKLAVKLVIKDYNGLRRGGLKLLLPLKVKSEGLLIPKAAILNRYANPKVKIKKTGVSVPVLILGEEGDDIVVVEDQRLQPGIELLPAPTN
ncbi:MAG: efflux RND transporter periplasmic adaptor subunit [Desulfobacterales bacterium]|nr:efflux RND transporter periplasmic adaptor subunit [Desulfobacterales bacterium]